MRHGDHDKSEIRVKKTVGKLLKKIVLMKYDSFRFVEQKFFNITLRPKSIISDRFADALTEIGHLLLELGNVSRGRKLLRDEKAEFRPGMKEPFVKRTIVRHALKNSVVKKSRRMLKFRMKFRVFVTIVRLGGTDGRRLGNQRRACVTRGILLREEARIPGKGVISPSGKREAGGGVSGIDEGSDSTGRAIICFS